MGTENTYTGKATESIIREAHLTKQIENYIEENLTDEARQTALEFISYLRTNKMEFVKDNGYWKDKIYYLIKFRNECVCFIAIKDPDEPENLWTIWSDNSKLYEDSSVEEDIKNIAWKYVDNCGNCGSCGGGKPKIVFGKSFEKVCGCTFRVDNAKISDIPFLKKMVDLRKKDIRRKNAVKKQLKLIAKSYDRGIDLGRKGIDSYENFPAYITNHPNYPLFQQMKMSEILSDSGRKEIVRYLGPKVGMKFIDLGCCLNLMFRGYKDWSSAYYGVDISSKTIELLHEFTEKNALTVGDLHCGSMHETPYDTSFFDIGGCIGSLEYFEKDFVQQAVVEFHRIMKPNGKFVLDIPNVGTPEFEITKLIEEYLGRPDKFNLSAEEFETMLDACFIIDKKEIVGPMIQYFLVCKK